MNHRLTSYGSKDSPEFDFPQIIVFLKIPNTSSHNLAAASNKHITGHESQLTTQTRTAKLIQRLIVLLNRAETSSLHVDVRSFLPHKPREMLPAIKV